MLSIEEIADRADMIVDGYSFTKENEKIKILNLNNPEKALSISLKGEIIATTMDDIEISIVKEYWEL